MKNKICGIAPIVAASFGLVLKAETKDIANSGTSGLENTEIYAPKILKSTF